MYSSLIRFLHHQPRAECLDLFNGYHFGITSDKNRGPPEIK